MQLQYMQEMFVEDEHIYMMKLRNKMENIVYAYE